MTKLNVDDIPLSEEELILAMQEYDALLPTVTDKINDKIIGCENRKVKKSQSKKKRQLTIKKSAKNTKKNQKRVDQ